MPQVNVSLPEGLKAWADQRVASGYYSSSSDYIRDLMRRDQQETEHLAWLQAEIDLGLASGVDPRESADVFRDIRAKYLPENG